MRKVKIFRDNKYELEERIDEWLSKNPNVKVISISGTTYSEYSIITYVLYEVEEKPESLSLNS